MRKLKTVGPSVAIEEGAIATSGNRRLFREKVADRRVDAGSRVDLP
jgi:hypothetical protein